MHFIFSTGNDMWRHKEGVKSSRQLKLFKKKARNKFLNLTSHLMFESTLLKKKKLQEV